METKASMLLFMTEVPNDINILTEHNGIKEDGIHYCSHRV